MIKRIAKFLGFKPVEIREDQLPGTRPLRGVVLGD